MTREEFVAALTGRTIVEVWVPDSPHAGPIAVLVSCRVVGACCRNSEGDR